MSNVINIKQAIINHAKKELQKLKNQLPENDELSLLLGKLINSKKENNHVLPS